MEKKLTAMGVFSEWLKAFEYELPLELQVKAKECLEIEKQQIKDAWNESYENCEAYGSDNAKVRMTITGEQYYEQNFETK
jgi:hypothetical protein